MDKIREILDEYEKFLMAIFKSDGCYTSAITEIYKNKAITAIQQEMIKMLLEKKYLIDNLPKEKSDNYLEDVQKARDTVDGYNQAISDMYSKIMGIKPGEEK